MFLESERRANNDYFNYDLVVPTVTREKHTWSRSLSIRPLTDSGTKIFWHDGPLPSSARFTAEKTILLGRRTLFFGIDGTCPRQFFVRFSTSRRPFSFTQLYTSSESICSFSEGLTFHRLLFHRTVGCSNSPWCQRLICE